MVTELKVKQIFLLFQLLHLPEDKASQARNPGFQKFWKFNLKMPEHENSSDHQRAIKE